jgi:hypothetical protein
MFNIKVKENTHKGIKKVSKILAVIAFVVIFVVVGYQNVTGYIRANEILADHTVVDASLTFEGVSEERGRKGRVREVYHFSYQFDGKGQQYVSEFTTSESSSGYYLERDVIPVAYNNSDPGKFDRLSELEEHGNIMSNLKRMGLGSVMLMFILAMIYMLITRKLIVPKQALASGPTAA